MSKDKNTTPEGQPVAAPVGAPQEPVQTPPATEPKEGNAETETAEETAPQPYAEEIEKCRMALRSFPTLPEGYVCAKGIYFDRAVAESKLDTGEELIIVTLEKK